MGNTVGIAAAGIGQVVPPSWDVAVAVVGEPSTFVL